VPGLPTGSSVAFGTGGLKGFDVPRRKGNRKITRRVPSFDRSLEDGILWTPI